jgi:hypothetical protein
MMSDSFISCSCHRLTRVETQLVLHVTILWNFHTGFPQVGIITHQEIQDIIMPAWVKLWGASSALPNDNSITRVWVTALHFHLWWSSLHFHFLFLIFAWPSCHAQWVCTCLLNPFDSSLCPFMPWFIFISATPDCPHSAYTHKSHLHRTIITTQDIFQARSWARGGILHLSMCIAL